MNITKQKYFQRFPISDTKPPEILIQLSSFKSLIEDKKSNLEQIALASSVTDPLMNKNKKKNNYLFQQTARFNDNFNKKTKSYFDNLMSMKSIKIKTYLQNYNDNRKRMESSNDLVWLLKRNNCNSHCKKNEDDSNSNDITFINKKNKNKNKLLSVTFSLSPGNDQIKSPNVKEKCFSTYTSPKQNKSIALMPIRTHMTDRNQNNKTKEIEPLKNILPIDIETLKESAKLKEQLTSECEALIKRQPKKPNRYLNMDKEMQIVLQNEEKNLKNKSRNPMLNKAELKTKNILTQSNQISKTSSEDIYKLRRSFGDQMGLNITMNGNAIHFQKKYQRCKHYSTPDWVQKVIKEQKQKYKLVKDLSYKIWRHAKFIQ